MSKRYQCKCCENYVYNENPEGSWSICPVCNWEVDDVQERGSDFSGGANKMSLNQAKQNYKNFGAVSRDFIDKVRKPNNNEIPENDV
ncbi:TPA: hydrolase [Candidatus Falkowbacteria bacterium]|nr:hydrolase [Candidatus Falkowbacteria bacterium]